MNDSPTAGQIHARFRPAWPGFELDVDLAPRRGVTALFGHSGSGKTTCLRCVAGLERAGEAYRKSTANAGRTVRAGCSSRRTSAPWVMCSGSQPVPTPHGTAQPEYGLRRVKTDQRRVDWDHVVKLLGIEHLLERLPGTLSGVSASASASPARCSPARACC